MTRDLLHIAAAMYPLRRGILFVVCSLSFVVFSCNNKSEKITDDQIAIEKIKVEHYKDSTDIEDFKKYLDFEVEMHSLLRQLDYSHDSAQKQIDKEQMEMYSDKYSYVPQWYVDYRKRRDSNFTIPDSLTYAGFMKRTGLKN